MRGNSCRRVEVVKVPKLILGGIDNPLAGQDERFAGASVARLSYGIVPHFIAVNDGNVV